ncbi:unnamed protein product [Lathyrus sativus]|nr:unnamed protein product [Lathyrus sativus]
MDLYPPVDVFSRSESSSVRSKI